MSKRNDILNLLKTELKSNITSAIEVKRGIYKWDTIVNKPCICFSLEKDEVDEEVFASAGTDAVRVLYVYLYVYVDDPDGTNLPIHDFVSEIETFLNETFTHCNNTYVIDIGFIEGGVSAPCSFADMNLQIKYMTR